MSVDYRKQYRPEQLEPFWPNEIMKMLTAVLCTLAVIMAFAVLPVALDAVGLRDIVHAEEPADPHGTTPIGIKPEWYFLASYQYLKLMPTSLFGVGGKTLGVVTQGVLLLALLAVPFCYRRGAVRRPNWGYRLVVTTVILGAVGLTIWGGWPAEHGEHGETPVSLIEYVRHKPLLFIVLGLGFAVFYGLIAHERNTIRRTLHDRPPRDADRNEGVADEELP
jgi:ubiquinol-cytochrome c reductase cytochrome b subunit